MFKRHGLSLVETIVTIAVFAILAALATQLLIGGVAAWRKGKTNSELRSIGRKAVDEFTADFRQADATSINPPTPSSSPTAESYVEFDRYESSSSGTKSVTYRFTGNKLVREEASGTTYTLAENVLVEYPTGTKKSYFKWNWDPATASASTMEMSLYLIEDASTMSTEPKKYRQSFILTTTAFPMNKPIGTVASPPYFDPPTSSDVKSPAAIEQTVTLPASLEDPRGQKFRLPSRAADGSPTR